MSLCSFSSLDEIKCGCNGNISPNANIVFSLCDSDITSHLQANHIPCSTIKTECDLIKARAGYYEENANINNYVQIIAFTWEKDGGEADFAWPVHLFQIAPKDTRLLHTTLFHCCKVMKYGNNIR